MRFRDPRRPTWRVVALFAVAALMFAACPEDAEDPLDEPDEDGVEEEEEPDAAAEGPITIGLIAWDEAIAVTNLWQVILEEEGYEVEQEELEVGFLYSGVAEGDLDLFLDAWLPATHEDYWEQYGDDIEELGTWFTEAPLTWVVPAYVDEVDSIEDLQGNADMFDGQIIGIEPGSGLMRISDEEVMPTYELEDEYDLVESSTPAMLSELETAIENEEPIVVTLWEPHWAYGAFELKNLEDPENALGDPDEIRAIGRPGFADDFPEIAEWFGNWEMTSEEIGSLSEAVVADCEDDELECAREWLEDNRDVVEGWMNGDGVGDDDANGDDEAENGADDDAAAEEDDAAVEEDDDGDA
jgi:glycine betaine/proline transport system substrate-binding protein